MKSIFFSVVLSLSLSGAFAQVRFSASPSYRFMQRSTDFGTLHDFVQLQNHTADTLSLVWKVRMVGGDTAWRSNVQDPSNRYFEVETGDSAAFILPDSGAPSSLSKLIIGVEHRQVTGIRNYYFTLYEKGRARDTVAVQYEVVVTPGLATQNYKVEKEPTFYPNPARERIYFSGVSQDVEQLGLLSLSGKLQSVVPQHPEGAWELPSLPAGLYRLRFTYRDQYFSQILTIEP